MEQTDAIITEEPRARRPGPSPAGVALLLALLAVGSIFAILALIGREQPPSAPPFPIAVRSIAPAWGTTVDQPLRFECVASWLPTQAPPNRFKLDVSPAHGSSTASSFDQSIDQTWDPPVYDHDNRQVRYTGTVRFRPALPPGSSVGLRFEVNSVLDEKGATRLTGTSAGVTVRVR